MIIKDLASTREFFRTNITTPIFGVGVWAFNRLGLENVFSDYQILCLRHSPDTALIEKNLQVLSLEKGLKKHLNVPRNSTSILLHEKTQEYLKAFKNPLIIPYKSSSKMERVCQENGWTLGIAPLRFGKNLFENKIIFRKILEKINASPPPGFIIPFEKLSFDFGKNNLGLPFVVQHPTRGGGKGTFFINNQEEFSLAYDKLVRPPQAEEGEETPEDRPGEVLVTKFIKGTSPSIAGCVTRHGTLTTNLQEQVLDIPDLFNPQKGSGLFCGHDWTFSQNISKELNGQAISIAQKVGSYFASQGYKGIFGLDFVTDEKNQKLYVVECNPRMTGAFPTIEMSLLKSGTPPLIAFHALEYLDVDYQMDVKAINLLLQKPKQGAHMFMHNLTQRWAFNYGSLKPGVYVLKNKKPVFLRSGYRLSDIQTSKEFVVTEGVPVLKRHFSPNRRLCRILTKASVLEEFGKLNPWAQEVVRSVYDQFKLKPARLIKIKKFFNPNYLAKG